MLKWTKKQQLAFLIYLLFLNIVVFGGLAYFLFTVNFSDAAPASEQIVEGPTATLNPTATPFPLPTAQPTRSGRRLAEHLPTMTPTPFPGSIPVLGRLVSNTAENFGADFNKPITNPYSETAIPPKPTATLVTILLTTSTPSSTATPTTTSTPTTTPSPTNTNTPRPTATATPTTTPTKTPSATPTATPPPTPTPSSTSIAISFISTPTTTVTRSDLVIATPIPVAAVASLTNEEPGSDISAAHLAHPDQLPVSSTSLASAIPVSENRVALKWSLPKRLSPATKAQYRIYSDMGSGYGVYIYKAQTDQPTFIDKILYSGRPYIYQITQVNSKEETILTQVQAAPLDLKQPEAPLARKELTATLRVTPAPTALPADTILLGLLSDNRFADDFDNLTIAGEVRNDSNLDAGETEITVTFYNKAGTAIKTAQGETMLDVIPPGETSPFLITLPRPAGMASHSLRATARPVSPELRAQLSTIEVRRFEDDAGFFHIKGVVENVGNITAKRAKISAVIYGRDGRVINVGFASTQPPTLAPGERATYDVIFTYYPRYVSQVVIPFEE